MTDQGPAPGSGPSVCPFVALAEDRDRRASSPDEGNRCYAEKAPRQRDLVYQADYCYSQRFASCSVFLAWAARNAAEPSYVTEAAQRAWGSGVAAPEPTEAAADHDTETAPAPTPEGGLFGPADPTELTPVRPGESFDWVSASAWAEAPWDERAEQEAAELEELAVEEPEAVVEDQAPRQEDTQAPKVPAALPVRRRKRPQAVISSRGSGEWYYADPPSHEPLVSRRTSVAPPIMLAALGLLVAALVVFMIPALLFGGGDDEPRAAALASPSPQTTIRPQVTRAPVAATALPTVEPSVEPTPRPETHTVKRKDTLTSIAQQYGVRPAHIVCLNNIKNRNIVVLGATYKIPPEGFKCPPNWRNQN